MPPREPAPCAGSLRIRTDRARDVTTKPPTPPTAQQQAKRRRKKRKRPLPAWTHGPITLGVRTMSAAANLAGVERSMRAMHDVGGWFGELKKNEKRLQRAVDNIAWCFPELEPEECRAYAVSAYRHLFTLGAEVLCTPGLIDPITVHERVDFRGFERALELLRSGRPTLLVTGHCGNWELLGTIVAQIGFPVHALYRPLDLKPLNDWVVRTRRRQGVELVDKFGATDLLPPLMEQGMPVGFIADQNAGDKGMFVPFFDRLASAYKTIGVLAMRYEAPVLCGHAFRLPPIDGREDRPRFRYRMEMTDVIEPHHWADQPDPLFYITARYRLAIEKMVRATPEQYLWMHRYWKSRPRHERQGKPFPDRLRAKIAELPWMTPERVERIVERSAYDGEAWRAQQR